MNAFLEIYLSTFWSWAGITIGVAAALGGAASLVAAFRSR